MAHSVVSLRCGVWSSCWPSKSFALAICELRLATDPGAGDRPAMCRDRRWSFDCVTACQGCVLANLCPRCAALARPSAKTWLLDLRAGPLAPKADTLARRFPVCWVQPRRFLRVGARPPFRRVGDLPAGRARPACRLAFRIQVHMKPLVPRRDCPQDKGQAGFTPHGLCRDCPAPREDSVSGNITANRQKRSGRRGSRTAGYAELIIGRAYARPVG